MEAKIFFDLFWLPSVNEVWGKVIFSVACVKNSVHRGRVPGRVHPLAGTPLQAGTPPKVHSPWSSACWEIRATSGRYASYWNAFLFFDIFRFRASFRSVWMDLKRKLDSVVFLYKKFSMDHLQAASSVRMLNVYLCLNSRAISCI